MFENLKFQTRFLHARLREQSGDYVGSAALLNHVTVPDRFRSLRDAYRLRMLVLNHAPERGPEIIAETEAFPWFIALKSPAVALTCTAMGGRRALLR